MKKLNLFLMLLLLCGCTIFLKGINEIDYSLTLVEVARPKETKERWGETEKVGLSEENKYHYEDQLVDSYFLVLQDRIAFDIENKTGHSIMLLWNEAAFIDVDGDASRLMHSGVKYVDRNAYQIPSVIPAGGKISDVALPVDRVFYVARKWKHLGLIEPDFEISPKGLLPMSDSLKTEAADRLGTRIGLLLPLEIQGTVNEYTFWFEIADFSVLEPVLLHEHRFFK